MERQKKKGIGEIIYQLRVEAGYTQEQLAKGICGATDLVRMESDYLVPGHFVLDRIFGRLGRSTECLEYTLRLEVYQLYELRYLIQTAVCHHQFAEAEALLMQYEERKEAEQPLHRQYIEQERAQIAWLTGENTEKVLEILERAIARTMPSECGWENGDALSAEELKLLLFRWELCREAGRDRAVEELEQMLSYIEQHYIDEDVKVGVYPYVVLLLTETYDWKEQYDHLLRLTDQALELLRESGKLLYMTEIIEKYVQLLRYGSRKPKKAKRLRRQRKSLLSLEAEFQVYLEKYRLFQHINREFELDYEVIRKSRIAKGISQEELSWEICASATLSRIENGRQSPSNRNMEKLLERLERTRSRINTVLTTEEFEVIELKRELEKSMQRVEKEKAEKLLTELESRLDLTEVNNRQYISTMRLNQKYQKKMVQGEACIEECQKILQMTLSGKIDEIYKHSLTDTESIVFNILALSYYLLSDKERSIYIYKKLLESYERSKVTSVFYIRRWGLMMSNLIMCLEETGEFDEAIKNFNSKIKLEMEIGKINGIVHSLVTMASITEQKKDKENGKIRFTQVLDMLHLMKRKLDYKTVKAHMKNPEFFLNE